MMELTRIVCALCLSTLICFLPTGSGLQMVVLCHGEDGHIAIEPAGSNCCAESLASCSLASPVPSSKKEFPSQNNCGACVDIPISIGLATIVKEPYQVDYALPTQTTVAPATIDNPAFSEYLSISEPFTPSYYLTPLRSIILLI